MTRRDSAYSVQEIRSSTLGALKLLDLSVETGGRPATAVEAGQELSNLGTGRHCEG